MDDAIQIFYHGTVLTMMSEFDRKDGFIIQGKRIQATFDRMERERIFQQYPRAHRVNLQGQTVIPGLIMSHLHLIAYAFFSRSISVSPMNLYFYPDYVPPRSSKEVLDRIRDHLTTHPSETLYIQGYDPVLQPGPIISRTDLDTISSRTSIAIMTSSMHNIYVNTALLFRAELVSGLTPEGRLIFTSKAPKDRHASFELGSIAESDLLLVGDLFNEKDKQDRFEDLSHVSRILNRKGITTIGDAYSPIAEVQLYYEYYQTYSTSLRLVVFPNHVTKLSSTPDISGLQILDHLSIGPIKLIVDGSCQGYTAKLSHPYYTPPFFRPSDRKWTGEIFYTFDQLKKTLEDIFRRRNKVAIHANGDATIGMLLQVMEAIVFENIVSPRAVRIEHCTTIRPDQVARLAYINRAAELLYDFPSQLISPSFLINHVYYYGDVLSKQVLGPDVVIDPVATVVQSNINWDVHSDSPVTPPDPLSMMKILCTRTTSSGRILNPEQRITPYQALCGLTCNAARSLGLSEIGTLAPGQFADFVIVSANPLITPFDQIEVVATYLDGQCVYQQ